MRETTTRPDGSYGLDYIDIFGYNTAMSRYDRIKRYDLQFTTRTTPDNRTTRTFLSAIRLLQGDDATTVVGSYSITYNAASLPELGSRSKDYWGFYNLNGEKTLIQQRTKQIQVYSSGSGLTPYVIGDANREPDSTRMRAAVIESIRYPTGGLTTFEFETNRYADGSSTGRLSGGLRLRRLRNYTAAGELATTKTYRYGPSGNGLGKNRSVLAKDYTPTLDVNFNQPFGTATPYTYSYTAYWFTSAPTYPLTPDEGSPVTYGEVAEYSQDGAGNSLGKTVSVFRDDADDIMQLVGGRVFVSSTRWNRGQLLSQTMTNGAGQLVAQLQNSYQTIASGQTTDIVAGLVQLARREIGTATARSGCNLTGDLYRPLLSFRFQYGVVKPVQTTNTLYADDNSGRKTVTVTQTDYNPRYLLPRETRMFVEGGAVTGTRISYPQDYSIGIPGDSGDELLGISQLIYRNAYLPMETIAFRQANLTAARYYTGGLLTTYKSYPCGSLGCPVPLRTLVFESNPATGGTTSYVPAAQQYNTGQTTGLAVPADPGFAERLTVYAYDTSLNPTSWSLTSGMTTTLAYATYNPAGAMSFSTLVSQTQNPGQPSAQKTAYTYTVPMLGPASVTDPRLVRTTYRYDGFGRLQAVLDKDNNVLKQYTYRYTTAQP